MTDNDIVNRGQQAEALLNNQTFREAIILVEHRLTQQWKASTDAAEREDLWFKQKGVVAVVGELATALAEMQRLEFEKEDGYHVGD